jgi:NAD(P)-dependent dehydrogenase (short-subunit alcohol dehydrogenase family)
VRLGLVKGEHGTNVRIEATARHTAGQTVASQLPAARAVAADVSDVDQVDQVVETVTQEHGRLDVVVHAAGVDDPEAKELIADAIVEIGSSSAFDAPVGYPHYAASKAGVHALAQAVAKEASAFGVRVNVVAPGPTDTGMATRTPDALRQANADPRVRPYATPDEIADIALFLASEQASNLVGAVLLANGGRFTPLTV